MRWAGPPREVWAEQWSEVVGPLMDEVMMRARPVSRDDLQLILERSGYPEECYFTFSYNPILDDNGVTVGVSNIVTETTRQVLSERRLRLVQSLGAVSATRGDTIADTCRALLAVLAGTRHSVPFAVALLRGETDGLAHVVGAYGLAAVHGRRA